MVVYTSQPPNPSNSTTATFAFSDSSPYLDHLECSLEDGPWFTCTSPYPYTLTVGDHEFSARAVDLAGNISDENEIHWTIKLAATSLTTALSPATITIGSSTHDTASLTGETAGATGTVTYTVYPTPTACSAGTGGTPEGSGAVSGASVGISNPFAPSSAGTYYWGAVYSGDGSNSPATSACELLTVTKVTPVLATNPSGPVTVGSSITDVATLSGFYGAGPGGFDGHVQRLQRKRRRQRRGRRQGRPGRPAGQLRQAAERDAVDSDLQRSGGRSPDLHLSRGDAAPEVSRSGRRRLRVGRELLGRRQQQRRCRWLPGSETSTVNQATVGRDHDDTLGRRRRRRQRVRRRDADELLQPDREHRLHALQQRRLYGDCGVHLDDRDQRHELATASSTFKTTTTGTLLLEGELRRRRQQHGVHDPVRGRPGVGRRGDLPGISGFTVSPTGAPAFTVTNMVPGDVRQISGITVQVTGTASSLTGIFESVPVNKTCAQDSLGCPAGVGIATDFAHELQLTILDNTTGLTVYSGTLDGLSLSAASPQRICAIGSTNTGAGCVQTWAAGELHSFTFTVSFPLGGGNTYQGTGTSLTFTWGRT